MKKYPISIRDVSPGDGAVRLTGARPDGFQDGVHTGGAWLLGGEVFKPLDGRPYANAEFHIPTQELEVLELMKGRPGFPANWCVEDRNGRKFLVRIKAFVLFRDTDHIQFKDVLLIEQAVRDLNARYWEVNDALSVAFDGRTDEPFILDLSAAQHIKNSAEWLCADDWGHIERWFERLGLTAVVSFRQNARHVISVHHFDDDWPGRAWRHVYASKSRPINFLWASIPDAFYVDGDYVKTGVWTWVIVPDPLDAETVYRYELTWGWSPICYQQ